MGMYTVEMFGLPESISGTRSVQFELPENAKLTDLVGGLKKAVPAFTGEIIEPDSEFLMEGFAFNINGRFYSDDRSLVLNESDHIILLTMAIVG